MEDWKEEITEIAGGCGYTATSVLRRGTECMAVSKNGHTPSHINERVWKYLKEHGNAAEWLTLWLLACDHSREILKNETVH